ncbi:MAG: hypothetical protein ACRDN9_09125 [Streptosporangiaceae bacterium]
MRRTLALPALGVVAGLALAACGGSPSHASAGAAHTPASEHSSSSSGVNPNGPETHPPGDIPDNTVYVPFTPHGGAYRVKVPQGWARTQVPGGARFISKLNSVTVTVRHPKSAPTPSSARANEVPAIKSQAKHVTVRHVKRVHLPGGKAVEVDYLADSNPSQVTGKVVRDAVERFDFYRDGTEVVLTLSGPEGADNVDPWRIISHSFRWTR